MTTQTETQTPQPIASFSMRFNERVDVIQTPGERRGGVVMVDYGVWCFDNETGRGLGQPMFFAVAANAIEWARMKSEASFGRGSASLIDCPDQGAAK